ncbi:MAG: thiamine-phosphate kinase [Conexivisphaerales archaeon]
MNELEIIDTIRRVFGASVKDRGLYDDVATIAVNRHSLMLKVDMFVADSDMPSKMTLKQAARKAVISCLSDFAVKGAKAEGFMVSLALPRSISNRKQVEEIVQGLKQASDEFSLKLIAGDVNESKSLTIDCIVYGQSGTNTNITRAGAKPGDIVISTGPFGYTALGLKHLLEGFPLPLRIRKKCVDSVLNPNPPFELTREIAKSGLVNASMDSSDGLAITLYEIAQQSGVAITVSDLPTDTELINSGIDKRIIKNSIFFGGEEYSGIFTLHAQTFSQVEQIARSLNSKIYKVGYVEKGEGVSFMDGSRIEKKGWIHLSNAHQ